MHDKLLTYYFFFFCTCKSVLPGLRLLIKTYHRLKGMSRPAHAEKS